MTAVRFREPPRTGARAAFKETSAPGHDSVTVSPSTGPDSAVACREWWLLEPFLLHPGREDTVFVAVRRIADATGPGSTDAAFVLLSQRKVVFRSDFPLRWEPDAGFVPRRTIRAHVIRSDHRNVLFVRIDSADLSGSERYRVFGVGPANTLQEFTGPVEYFRDGDLPSALAAGQVLYTRVRIAWYTVPLPLTFEPQRTRFVPEVGDDALFSASGKATFRGEAGGSSLIRLFSSTGPGASSVSLPIPPHSEAEARKAYLPHLLPGSTHGSPRGAGMVYVTIGSLEGWLPDSLVSRFSP